MTYNAPDIAWAPLVPVMVVLIAGALGVLIEAFMRTVAMRRMLQLQLAVVALVASLFAIVWQWVAFDGDGVVVLDHMIYLDRQALAWQFLLVVFAIGLVALLLGIALPVLGVSLLGFIILDALQEYRRAAKPLVEGRG